MNAKTDAARRRPVAFAAAVLGWVMLAIYLTLIVVQDDTSLREILPWALLMAAAAAAATASVGTAGRHLGRGLMIAAALGYGLLGVLSLLSIGIGFLLAAALALGSVVELSRRTPQQGAGS